MTVPATAGESRFSRGQIYLTALLASMILLNYLDRAVLSIVSPVMREELGLSQQQYSHALNAFLIAYAAMYLGSGVILDKIGARRGLAIFVLLWSVVSGLHALTGGFLALVVFRFLLGCTEPGGWTGAVKTIAERFSAAQRGVVSGVFTAGAGVGALIAPPLIVFLMLQFGWRAAFWVTGLAGLVWLPLWWRATSGWPEVARGQSTTPALRDLPRALADRGALAFAGVRFFGDSTGYFFLFWLPEYLVSSKGFSIAEVGYLAWIPFLFQDAGAVLGGYGSGRLVRRGYTALHARRLVMSAAAACVLVGATLQGLGGMAGVIAAVSLCTFGVGLWAGNLHAIPADAFPQGRVATVHGLGGSAGAVGGVFFNWLVGALSASDQYSFVFLVLAALQPLGLICLWVGFSRPRPAPCRSL